MSTDKFYEFTFEWTIENFSHCIQMYGESIQSPVFAPDCLSGTQWNLNLFPRGNKNDGQHISLYLKRRDDQMSEKEIFLEQNWELLDADDKIFHSVTLINTAYKKNVPLGYPYLLKLRSIQECIKECNEDKITFRCHIRRSKPQICKAVTKINVDDYTFQWTVAKPNSHDWMARKQVAIQEYLQFQIDITAPEDDILIKLNKIETEYEQSFSLFMKCKLSLLNVKGHTIKSEIAEYLYDSSFTSWQLSSFIKKSELEAIEDNVFEDNCFTLEWKFSYSKDFESYVEYAVSTLKSDLGKMLKKEKHCDLQLRSEGVLLSAHKSILSARSPVFSAMFDQNMIENKSGIVDIVDCDSSTLKNFLEYLYNDTLEEIGDSETALNLLFLADKYQVHNLKELCCSILISNLTNKNVCKIILAADMIEHKHLKSAALNYLKPNAKQILSSSEGRELVKNNSNLAAEMICYFAEL